MKRVNSINITNQSQKNRRTPARASGADSLQNRFRATSGLMVGAVTQKKKGPW